MAATATQIASLLPTLALPTDLTIHSLSTPLLSSTTSSTERTSTSSTTPSTTLSPTSLLAELEHYKSLFSKLRFSYTEQVTKERLLKTLLSPSGPEFPSPASLSELEEKLRGDKASLKQKKADVAGRIGELEGLSRGVSARYQVVAKRRAELESVPARLEGLEGKIEELRALLPEEKDGNRSEDPDMILSLAETGALVRTRVVEAGELEGRITKLQNAVPNRREEVRGLEGEVKGLQERKREAVEMVRDVERKKRARTGGRGVGERDDESEVRGTWLKAEEAVLRSMLEV